jgi:hypothetical protein
VPLIGNHENEKEQQAESQKVEAPFFERVQFLPGFVGEDSSRPPQVESIAGIGCIVEIEECPDAARRFRINPFVFFFIHSHRAQDQSRLEYEAYSQRLYLLNRLKEKKHARQESREKHTKNSMKSIL